MRELVAIDTSVTSNRVRLVFSDRAVAAAYAAYLRALDLLPPQRRHPQLVNYQRMPEFRAPTKEVTFCLPEFISWFITCRLPDDEDTVTFGVNPPHEAVAAYWADSMVLFEEVVSPDSSPPPPSDTSLTSPSSRRNRRGASRDRSYCHNQEEQLHVRRLWNKTRLLRRLEELRRRVTAPVTAPASGQTTPVNNRSRVTSPVWNGSGYVLINSGGKSAGGSGKGSPASTGAVSTSHHGHHHHHHHQSVIGGVSGRVPVPVPLTVPAGRMRGGDIWW